MSAADKPRTPAGYEQSPNAPPLSPAKKRRKAPRNNSNAHAAGSAPVQPDQMPMIPSASSGMKMMDDGNSGIMSRGSFEDNMAMQAAIGGQQQQMMAAVQQHGHQRHVLYPGARPVVSGATEHLLQHQNMPVSRSVGQMNMLQAQSMQYSMPTYVCGICRRELQEFSQAIFCGSGCNIWFHRQCTGLTEVAYQLLMKEPCAEWVCDNCLKVKNIPLMKVK